MGPTYASPIDGHGFCLCSSYGSPPCLGPFSQARSTMASTGHLRDRRVLSWRSQVVSRLSMYIHFWVENIA